MDRDQVLAILRAHEPELRAAGVEHLRLFGSVARGEQTPESDVDVLVEMDKTRSWGFALGGIQADLNVWLGPKAHLSERYGLRQSILDRVLRDALEVF